MEFEYLGRYKYPTGILLNLTDNCNLACIYCFVQQKPHYMPLDIAKQAVDFIVNNYNIKKERGWLRTQETKRITFFGGEPMLMFDQIIVPLIEYIENNYDINEFKFDITTNGTLLSEERLIFMKKYNISILLSIDGDKETQDYNRPCKDCNSSSFNLVSKNIPFILKYFPDTVFRSTVYKDTIKNLFQNYLYAEEIGFKNYICIPDSRSQNWTEEDLENYKNEIFKIMMYYLSYYVNNELPKLNFYNFERSLAKILINDIDVKINKKIKNTFDVTRCGMGIITCSVNYQGDIFSCQEQDSREYGDYFYIGNLNDGIDQEKHERILKDYFYGQGGCEKKDNCKDCLLELICSHGCPSTQKDIFNDMTIMPYIVCEESKFTLEITMNIMSYLVQTNNPLFYEKMRKKLKSRGVINNGE